MRSRALLNLAGVGIFYVLSQLSFDRQGRILFGLWEACCLAEKLTWEISHLGMSESRGLNGRFNCYE